MGVIKMAISVSVRCGVPDKTAQRILMVYIRRGDGAVHGKAKIMI
jgi:hypothetical protein